MKQAYYLLIVLLSIITFTSCSDDEQPERLLNQVAVPSNLEVAITVTQDNSGVVTFTPSGTSVSSFTLNYGDGSETETIIAGETVAHTYTEGTFTVNITGFNLTGDSEQIVREVILSFLPPESLAIEITPLPGNSFGIDVSATADFASNFDVFFGDVANETATNFEAGSSATHIYQAIGTYEVTVVARNGGSETIEGTETVTIENPVILPLDFEDTMQEFVLVGFEGAESEIIDNPVSGGINTSLRVVRTVKTEGAQFFAGTFTDVDLAIDFSTSGMLSIKSYSPKVGIPVRVRIENSGNTASAELDVNTTVANQWETLVYDFSGQLDTDAQYIRIVIFFEFVPDLPGDGTTYFFDDIQVAN